MACMRGRPPVSARAIPLTTNGRLAMPIKACWTALPAGPRLAAGTARVCGLAPWGPPPQAALAQNPLYVPSSDREFLWNQFVDTIDDYFDIEREERVRLVGGVLTEGQIDTLPQPGATVLDLGAKTRRPASSAASPRCSRFGAGGGSRPPASRRRLSGRRRGLQRTRGRRQPEYSTVFAEACATTRHCAGPAPRSTSIPRRSVGFLSAATPRWSSAFWRNSAVGWAVSVEEVDGWSSDVRMTINAAVSCLRSTAFVSIKPTSSLPNVHTKSEPDGSDDLVGCRNAQLRESRPVRCSVSRPAAGW